MDDVELFGHIRDELKLTVRRLLDQLRRDHPADRLYAILFEVDDSGTYAYPIAGSEESLARLVEKYIVKGYRIQSGDLPESLRASLRWDAPGDDMDGWYWGDKDDQIAVTRLIEQAVQAGLIEVYGEDQPLWRHCLEALRQLDSEGIFGSGLAREQVLIGATCCEVSFGAEAEQLEELATLNSPSTIARLREELAAATAADGLLLSPRTTEVVTEVASDSTREGTRAWLSLPDTESVTLSVHALVWLLPAELGAFGGLFQHLVVFALFRLSFIRQFSRQEELILRVAGIGFDRPVAELLRAIGNAVAFEVGGRHVHVEGACRPCGVLPVPVEQGLVGDEPAALSGGVAAGLLAFLDPVRNFGLCRCLDAIEPGKVAGGLHGVAPVSSILSRLIPNRCPQSVPQLGVGFPTMTIRRIVC